MMLDKIFIPTLRNCPHRDCRRLLDKITTHHGMVFCPYCHKSIVVNPVSASINLTFGGFFKCYVKNNYKWLSVFLSVLVVFYYTIVFVDDYMANVSDVLFIGIMLLLFSLKNGRGFCVNPLNQGFYSKDCLCHFSGAAING